MKRKEAKLNNLYVFGSKGYSKRERTLKKNQCTKKWMNISRIFFEQSCLSCLQQMPRHCDGICEVRVGDLEHTKMDSKNFALINILEKWIPDWAVIKCLKKQKSIKSQTLYAYNVKLLEQKDFFYLINSNLTMISIARTFMQNIKTMI